MNGFVKLYRSPVTERLLRDPIALALLMKIALRARWRREAHAGDELALGEALIGDYNELRTTRRGYRTRVQRLVRWGLITIRPTPRGTIAKLTSSTVFDIGSQPAENRPSERPSNHIGENGSDGPSQRPTNGHQVASNRPLTKKERKKEGVVVAHTHVGEQRDHSAKTPTVEELLEELQREFPNNNVRDEHRRFRAYRKRYDRTPTAGGFRRWMGRAEPELKPVLRRSVSPSPQVRPPLDPQREAAIRSAGLMHLRQFRQKLAAQSAESPNMANDLEH